MTVKSVPDGKEYANAEEALQDCMGAYGEVGAAMWEQFRRGTLHLPWCNGSHKAPWNDPRGGCCCPPRRMIREAVAALVAENARLSALVPRWVRVGEDPVRQAQELH